MEDDYDMSTSSTDNLRGDEIALSSIDHANLKMSNPYRLQQAKEASFFNDLQSARSAILSGSGRSRNASAKVMNASTDQNSDLGDEPYELRALTRRDLTLSEDTPLSPATVQPPTIRSDLGALQNGRDSGRSSRGQTKSIFKPVSYPTKLSPPTLNTVESTFTVATSPLAGIPGGPAVSSQHYDPFARQTAETNDRMQSGISHHPDQKVDSGSILAEGSTVGNIYRHYASSVRDPSYADGYQPKELYLSVGSLAGQLMGPSTPPPRIPLPSLPSVEQVVLDSTSQPPDIHSSNVFSDAGDSTVPSLPHFSPKAVCRTRSQSRRRSAVVSFASEDHCVYEEAPGPSLTQERIPLEREISENLRRVSRGYRDSWFSEASANSLILEIDRQLVPQTPYTHYSFLPARLDEFLAADPNTSVQERSFYDENAMVSDQTTHQNHAVRVPIIPAGALSKRRAVTVSPPLDDRRSDLQDGFQLSLEVRHIFEPKQSISEAGWETIADSNADEGQRQSQEIPVGLFGAYGHYAETGFGAKRTGSSIANTSDAGSSFSDLEVDNFNGSTDRIAQHPARIDYHGDYRQRELKQSGIPVLLPSYRQHRVNGYMADSTRAPPNPAQWLKSEPIPLKQPHKHPFKSTPPDVSPRAPIMPTSKNRRHANYFPPKSKMQVEQAPPAVAGASESWHNIVHFPDAATIPDFKVDGFNAGRDESSEADIADEGPRDGDHDAGASLHERLARRPMIRGPPGAFYAGLRLDGKRRVTGPHQETRLQRNVSQQSQRELHPLSLPTTPRYHPPLPPQRQSWREFLYNPDQLAEIERKCARDTNNVEANHRAVVQHWQDSMTESDLDGMTPRQFYHYPTLSPSRKRAADARLLTTCESISTGVCLACAFFPPLLGLYLAGTLNGIMRWATGGECVSFTRRGRKLAQGLLYCWLLAIIIGLVLFVIWWFTLHKHA